MLCDIGKLFFVHVFLRSEIGEQFMQIQSVTNQSVTNRPAFQGRQHILGYAKEIANAKSNGLEIEPDKLKDLCRKLIALINNKKLKPAEKNRFETLLKSMSDDVVTSRQ